MKQFYESAKKYHDEEKSKEAGSFKSKAIFELIEELATYQQVEQIAELFEEFIVPVLSKKIKSKTIDKLKQKQRNAYQLLYNILSSERPECLEFVQENIAEVQNLVLSALKTTCSTTLDARLR